MLLAALMGMAERKAARVMGGSYRATPPGVCYGEYYNVEKESQL
jgi:hypothetical protein